MKFTESFKRTDVFFVCFISLLFSLFNNNFSFAADRYWVGGAGSWQDNAHWSATDGGAGGASLPTSSDDVYFTANSGFGATTALRTITMDGGTAAVVRNITFNANFAPILTGSKRLDVYGNMTLQTGMTTTGWTGNLHFYGAGTITTNGVHLANRVIKFENTAGNYTFTDDFYRRGGANYQFVVDFANHSTTLTFNGVFYHSHLVKINKGTVILNQGFQPHPTSYLSSEIYNDGIIHSHGDGYAGAFHQRGEAYLHGHNYSFSVVSEANGTPLIYASARVFDISGCTIDIRSYWRYGEYAVGTFNAVGSTVNFLGTSTDFFQNDLIFYNVNVFSPTPPSPRRAFEWKSVYNGTHTQKYLGVVNLYSDVKFTTGGASGTPRHVSEFNVLNFYPGYYYYGDRTYTNSLGSSSAFRIRINGELNTNTIDCQNSVFLNYIPFLIEPGATVNVNAVHSEDIWASGPAAPYSLGLSSSAIGIKTGWDDGGPAVARTLVWVGPYETSANWYDMLNWRDVAIDPAAETVGPGYGGGTPTCPPLHTDSVIFLEGSHVFIDLPRAFLNTMEWRGGGELKHNPDLGDQEFQIFGSLYLHPNVDNQFLKPIVFRSSHPHRCIVKTANVPFAHRVIFNSQDGTGSWQIKDSLIALYEDPSDNVYTFNILSGHVHTGQDVCTTNPSSTIVTTRANWSKGSLSLYNSDVHFINGRTGSRTANLLVGNSSGANAFVVYPGKSTIYFIDSLAPGGGSVSTNSSNHVPKADLGQGQNYHNIVLKVPTGYTYPSFTHMISGSGCRVNTITAMPGSSVAFVSGNITIAGGGGSGSTAANHFRKVDLLSNQRSEFARATGNTYLDIVGNNTLKFIIDSLFSVGDIDFNTNIDIRANIHLSAGHNYNLGTIVTPTTMTILDGSSPAVAFGGCGAPQSYPDGAKIEFVGTCTEMVNINHGSLVVNSSNEIVIENAIIFENTASGSAAPLPTTNSILSGTTSGYIISPLAPRKLRWVDPSTIAGNTGNWNDADYWEQLLPVYAPAPQCPPTRVDTAIFDNTSFSAANQVVNMDIGTTQEVGSIYWENIPAGLNPVFQSLVNTQEFHIFASLAFHTNMVMNYKGLLVFRGEPSEDFPTSTILTANKPFLNKINFVGDTDNKVWSLLDELTALTMNYPGGNSGNPAGGTFNLMRGRFNTNGHTMKIKMFSAVPNIDTHQRYFDFKNSIIYLGGESNANILNYSTSGAANNTAWLPGVSMSQLASFTLESEGSTLDLNGLHSPSNVIPSQGIVMYAGGKNYDKIIFSKISPSGVTGLLDIVGATSTSSVKYLHFKNTLSSNGTAYIGHSTNNQRPDSIKVGTLISDANLLSIHAIGGEYDTVVFNGSATINSSNKYNDYAYFSPGRTYHFGAGEVQWFSNNCEALMIGSPGNNLSLYSTVTSEQTYFRKDSLYMCTDYVYMRDVWAVGNGNDPANSCTSYGNYPVNTFTPPSNGNPWIVSIADTITDYDADCEPWYYVNSSSYNRGRSDFTAGSNADNQGNNAGWNFSPYPTPPQISLENYVSFEVCQGDTITYPIVIQGDLPVVFGSSVIIDGDTTYNNWLIKDGFYMSGGTGLPGDPYIYMDTIIVPSDATSIEITDLYLIVERCFSNTATNDSSLFIDVNPTPSDLSVDVTPAGLLCPGSIAVIDPNSSIANQYNIYNGTSNLGGLIGNYSIATNYNTGSLYDSTSYFVEGISPDGCKYGIVAIIPIGDDVPPVITCLSDTTIYTNSSSCSIVVPDFTTSPELVYSDNCSTNGNLVITQTPVPGTFLLAEMDTTVWIFAEDDLGNIDSCSFILSVRDTISPTITCLGAITLSSNADCEITVPDLTAHFSAVEDNCTDENDLVITQSIPAGTQVTGTTVVWVYVRDAYDNVDSCSVQLIPEDNIPPTISNCPSDIAQDVDAGSCDAVVTWTAPTFTDNCTGTTLTSTHNSGDTFPIGTTTVTYTATDAAGNVQTCSFDVVITDNEAPVFTACPSDIAQDVDAGSCDAVVTWTAPTFTDNCTGTTLTSTHNSGDTFPIGTTTVTYTATDAAGNVQTCSFDVVITDNEAPVFTACPSDIAQDVDAGSCDAVVTWTAPTFTDNCTGTTLTSTHNSGDTFPIGTTTVTYTATDAAGNVQTCSFDVVITDNEAPVFTACPSDIAQDVDAGSCDAVVTWTAPTFTDNCTGTTLTSTHNSGDTFPIGTTTVTYTATDAAGNVQTCSFDVVITDNEAPVFTACPSDIAQDVDAGSCDAVVTWTAPTFTDNCTGTTLTSTHNSGDTFPIGTTTVTYTATDAAGNVQTCSFDVVITDNEAPVFTACPSDIAQDVDAGSCDAVVTWTAPTFTDNCTGTTLTSTHNSGDTFPIGTTTVTYTATDAAGNVQTCSFDVVITDNEAPVFTACPSDIAQDVDAGSCDAVVTWTAPTFTDNCTGTTLTSTHNSGDTFPIGTTTVTYTATDAAGNVQTCSFDVVITDNEAPVFTACPSDIAQDVDAGSCDAVVTWTAPTFTDNCTGTTLTSTHNSGDTFPIGTTTVTYTATDATGNVQTCSFDVVITDNEAPVFTACPSDIAQDVDAGSCDAVVTWTAPTFTDNCTGTTLTSTHNSGDTFPIGTTTVTYTATDAAGNVQTCSFDVVITDNEAPVFTACPSDIAQDVDAGSCDAVVTWTAPTFTDNCTGTTLTSTHNSGDVFPIGTTTVTYTATDGAGNTTTCSFDVTVEDTEVPVIANCPTDITVSTDASSCDAVVTWTAPTFTDNCTGTTLTSTHEPGDVFPIGTTTVTYTATDASGNTATCSFNVTVEDTEAPTVIVCPNDTIVYVGATNCEVEVTWIEPEFTDNCELTVTSTRANGSTFNVGLTTVTYTAVDGSGNVATCSFNVIVMDTIAPIISITDLVATSCSNTGITWNEELTDNCSIEIIQRSHTSGSVFEVGTTTVTYVVSDVNGNITTYSFDVTVDDVEQVELATSIVKQCVGNTVVLTVLNPNSDYTYTWYQNGVSVGTGYELVFANASTSVSGIYTVVATNSNGCTSEEDVEVIVENCGIIISETFSPNEDGSNDYFHIEGLENYPGTEIWIHNRWGVQVYHNPNYQNDWDGRSQSKLNVGGDELPEGTYYYILKLGGEAGTPNAGEIYKGFIYIKR